MIRTLRSALVLAVLLPSALAQDAAPATDDPYRWLEDVEGERALAWVEAQNAVTAEALEAHPAYDSLYQRTLAILNSDERIAYPAIRGPWLYNFWTDAANPRGVWRRTSWERYLAGEPAWDVLLDIDALGAAEGVNWAYQGATCLYPDYDRCLVSLSRGGADAAEVREFDPEARAFVGGGFRLPEAKSSVAWVDRDTLLVATDWGEGTLTTSGYPRVVKRWTRGTPLAEAETVFEGEPDDVGVSVFTFERDGRLVPLVRNAPSFFEARYYLVRGAETVALDLPLDADPNYVDGQLTLYLRSAWAPGGADGEAFPQGAVIATDFDRFVAGDADWQTVFAPTDRQTVEGTATTANTLLVSVLTEVRGELYRYRHAGGRWTGERVQAPDFGSVNVVSTSDADDRFFFGYSSFLQPSTLYLADADGGVREVRRLPAMFDAGGLVLHQHQATSADGTRVPYFVVHREGLALDGTSPTLLYGYGGFEVALSPSYSAVTGAAWLERGGVYVLANIRGGGEFGPAWHRAAQKANRQRAFDDFLAVAEDVVARGVTAPAHLGIMGGSNGGLLVGAALTQRPELFGAAVVQVPLLDMLRYHTLLAGASWMAEYGDPDVPEERAYIERYSPYQNVRPDAEYPNTFFYTSTRDDRVHPGHARKMAAKMAGMGHPVYYFENTEGGHGAGVTPEQRAKMYALTYAYLLEQLR